MDWAIWGRKAALGLIATMAAAGATYATGLVEAVQQNPEAAAWVAVVAPLILHVIGLVSNAVKHSGWL